MSYVQNLKMTNSGSLGDLTPGASKSRKDQDFFSMIQAVHESDRFQDTKISQDDEEKNSDISQGSETEDDKSFLYVSQLMPPQVMDIASKNSMELIVGSNENESNHLSSQETLVEDDKSFLYSSQLMPPQVMDITSKSNKEILGGSNESESNQLSSQENLKNSDNGNINLNIITNLSNSNQETPQKNLVNFTEIEEKQMPDPVINDKPFPARKDNISDELLTGTAIKQETLFNGDIQEKVRVSEIPTKINAILKEDVADKNSRTIELKLDPEHLGDLKVTINWNNGKLSAQFHTQTDEAAKTLKNEMEILKQNLTNMNIDVEGLSVSVFGQASGGFGAKSQQLPQYKRHKIKINYDDSVESLEQKQTINYFANASVNYLV